MSLVRLTYVSERPDTVDIAAVQNILAEARENNDRHDVTGLLYLNKAYFLQCLEGSSKAVNEIYQLILSDARHERPTLLDYRGISSRNFSKWSMAYVTSNHLSDSVTLSYLAAKDFEPFNLSCDAADELMLALGSVVVDE